MPLSTAISPSTFKADKLMMTVSIPYIDLDLRDRWIRKENGPIQRPRSSLYSGLVLVTHHLCMWMLKGSKWHYVRTWEDDIREIPSRSFFFLPKVPNLSQKDSSLSSFLGVAGLGDFGLGDAIFPPYETTDICRSAFELDGWKKLR